MAANVATRNLTTNVANALATFVVTFVSFSFFKVSPRFFVFQASYRSQKLFSQRHTLEIQIPFAKTIFFTFFFKHEMPKTDLENMLRASNWLKVGFAYN